MAKLMVGTEEVLKVMMGSEEITSLFMGSEEIPSSGSPEPQPVVDYSTMPFTIEALTSGDLVFTLIGDNNQSPFIGWDYSVNDGASQTYQWTGPSPQPLTISLSAGDKVTFVSHNASQEGCGYLQTIYGGFANSTLDFNAYGNLLSLSYIDFTNYDAYNSKGFQRLFMDSRIVSAENLVFPSGDVTASAREMFCNCSGLTTAPKVLPAQTIGGYSYNKMFYGCTSLEKSPELLFTGTTGFYSCQEMFKGDTSLN